MTWAAFIMASLALGISIGNMLFLWLDRERHAPMQNPQYPRFPPVIQTKPHDDGAAGW
jgi:hypothetical protein